MKHLLIILLLSPMLFVQAQNFRGLDKSPMDRAAYPAKYRISDKVAVITYSRPQLRGRSFSDVVPSNKIWRTGANEATELRVFKPITLGGKTVKEGTYSLYTIFEEGSVTVIVNSATNIWGAYSYDEANDVARVTVPYTTADESLEAFSIAFSGDNANPAFFMGWENIRVKVPFTVL